MSWSLHDNKCLYIVTIFTVLVSQGSFQITKQPDTCPSNLDLVVAIDASGSIKPFWDDAIDYVELLLSKFEVADHRVRIGLIDYSAVANAISPIDTGNNLGTLYDHLEELRKRQQNGETNTNLALERASEMFRGASRKDIPIPSRVLVMLTDGELTSGQYAELDPILKDLDDLKVSRFIAAVGNDTVNFGLSYLASKPAYQYKFDMVPSFTHGMRATQSLASAICFANSKSTDQSQQKPSEVKEGEEKQPPAQKPQTNQVQPQELQSKLQNTLPLPLSQPQTQTQQQQQQPKPATQPQTQTQSQAQPVNPLQVEPVPAKEENKTLSPPQVQPISVKQEGQKVEPNIAKEEQKAPTGQIIQLPQKEAEKPTDVTNEQKLQEYLNSKKQQSLTAQQQQQQQQPPQKGQPVNQIVAAGSVQENVIDGVNEIQLKKPEVPQQSVQQTQKPIGLQPNEGTGTANSIEVPECNINITRIGCFRDNEIPPRPFPVKILEDSSVVENGKDKKPFGTPEDWNKFLPDFICKCANAVRQRNFWSFGIQNYAQCFSGPDEGRYDEDGSADVGECVTYDYKPCLKTSEKCAGKEQANFVYSVFTDKHRAMQRIEYEKRTMNR